jgi:hypothetical protein
VADVLRHESGLVRFMEFASKVTFRGRVRGKGIGRGSETQGRGIWLTPGHYFFVCVCACGYVCAIHVYLCVCFAVCFCALLFALEHATPLTLFI